MWNFYIVLLHIHSGNCLQKIGILDLSLIKLLQNEQGCNFLPHSVYDNPIWMQYEVYFATSDIQQNMRNMQSIK